MANLSKLSAPTPPTIIQTGDVTTGRPSELAGKLNSAPYAAVTQNDGTTMLVSPKATISDALGRDSKHPYAKPSKADLVEQDKLIAEAGRDVEARHDAETNDLLDIMKRKEPGSRVGGMMGIRKATR